MFMIFSLKNIFAITSFNMTSRRMWINIFIVVGNLEMDKKFHPTLYNGCHYLSMQGSNWISVSNWDLFIIQVMIDGLYWGSSVLIFPMYGLWTIKHAIVNIWIYSETSVYKHPWYIPWICCERSFSEFYLSIWNQLVFNQRLQLFVQSPQPYLLIFAWRN